MQPHPTSEVYLEDKMGAKPSLYVIHGRDNMSDIKACMCGCADADPPDGTAADPAPPPPPPLPALLPLLLLLTPTKPSLSWLMSAGPAPSPPLPPYASLPASSAGPSSPYMVPSNQIGVAVENFGLMYWAFTMLLNADCG